MNRILLRFACAALAGALALPATALIPQAAPFAIRQAQAGLLAQHETTLASYGSFYEHAKYGKVWVPAATTVPQGWHPYPACNWVYTKYGWYFDDKTAWGEIVHHYGRWAHEPKLGWIWVPGEEFSPGWVMWRTSEQWIGWAPTPPDQDIKTLDADEFNTDKHWTFIETKKFGNCKGGDVVAATPQLFSQTVFLKEFTVIDGIVVFVFPGWFVGPIVNININFGPWAPIVIVNVIQNWIFVWNNININIACNVAPPPAPNQIINPIQSTPPAPPPGRRTELPPSRPQDPPSIRPLDPPSGGRPTYPPNVRPIDPVRPNYPGGTTGVRPIDPDFVRPNVDPVRPSKPGGKVGGIRPIDPNLVRPNIDPARPVRPTRPIDPGFVRPTPSTTGGGNLSGIKPINPRPSVPNLNAVPRRAQPQLQLQAPTRSASPSKPTLPNGSASPAVRGLGRTL
ncbi:MAG: DUF6600 domain-containing protein [Pseudorhodoplanes sp.]